MSEQTTPSLLEQLQAHHQAGYLSLHMPGHKENAALAPYLAQLGAEWDITELPGFDDLHAPEGILAKMMDRAAALWGSRKSCLLVNGSTGGLLAAMRGTTRRGNKILVARHCHKAIYHAMELCGLDPVFLTPATEPTFGLAGSISPEQVADALAQHPDVKLIVYPSPTYDGILSDTAGICAIAHEKGIPVLVDEAHGAHLGLHPAFPPSAMGQGADLAVASLHKMLPSLTQTAFLQLNGSLADPAEVERQLDVFETSSPSYPLLVSLDGCTGWLAQQGCAAFAAWRARLDRFDAAAKKLQNTRILCCGADAPHPDFFAHDAGKLLLQIGAAGAAYLRENGFEPEMVCGPNVLAMTSPCDAEDALDRLADVLAAWDKTTAPPAAAPHILPAPGAVRCTIGAALLRPSRIVPMQSAVGQTAAEYLWAYPPGVPLIAPGEEVTAALAAACEELEKVGTRIKHIGGSGPDKISVI